MHLLCSRAEVLSPSGYCSVQVIDEEGLIRPVAGPRLPVVLMRAIDGHPIGPDEGSCGSAAYHGLPVEVVDIAVDFH